MIYKYVSCKEVISKIHRDLNLGSEKNPLDIIEWAGEALEHIGVYQQLCKKQEVLKVEKYRALLPCGLFQLLQIEHCGKALRYLSGSFDTKASFVNENSETSPSGGNDGPPSGYIVNGSWLNFNFKSGEVFISYLGIMVDEEGFPMVPDLVSYKQAIFWYVLRQMLLGGYPHPSISFEYADRMWVDYCGQAAGDGNMPDIGKYEMIKEHSQMIIPNKNVFRDFFRNHDRGPENPYVMTNSWVL